MRNILLTLPLALLLGLTAIGASCDDNGTLLIFDQVRGLFDGGLPDANDDGIPEVSPDDVVDVNVFIDDATDCNGFEAGAVSSATLTFTPEDGTIEDPTDTGTGEDAICDVDGLSKEWTVPTEPGVYAVTVQMDVTFADGSTSSDTISGQLEVLAAG